VVECKVVEVEVEADNKGRSYVLKKRNKHGRKALGRSRNRRKKLICRPIIVRTMSSFLYKKYKKLGDAEKNHKAYASRRRHETSDFHPGKAGALNSKEQERKWKSEIE